MSHDAREEFVAWSREIKSSPSTAAHSRGPLSRREGIPGFRVFPFLPSTGPSGAQSTP